MIFEAVVDAISEVKEIPKETITMDSTFDELKVDSLDAIEVVFFLEDRLDLRIPDQAVRQMHDVRQVVDGLERLKRGEKIELPETTTSDEAATGEGDAAEARS